MIWHVLPNNDIKPHEESTTCHCEPVVKFEDGGDTIVIHNSFDGREGIEQANEILNNQTLNN